MCASCALKTHTHTPPSPSSQKEVKGLLIHDGVKRNSPEQAEITLYPFSNKWSTLAGLTGLVKYLALSSKPLCLRGLGWGVVRQTLTAVTERELMVVWSSFSGKIFKGEMKPLLRYSGRCRHKTPVTFSFFSHVNLNLCNPHSLYTPSF